MAAAGGGDILPDRLSDLPDSILITILSLLPIDEAARSSILASRWRRLFPSTLLDFRAFTTRDRGRGRGGSVNIISAVNSILANHPTARVCSFSTSMLNLRGEDDDASVDGWLHDLGRRGVQELHLSFHEREQEIPESLFACAALTRLRASNCTFPDAAAAAWSLARLTEVELFDVTISEDSLDALLSRCAALEHLTACDVQCRRVHVRSPSLKTFTCGGEFEELLIEHAPNLERVFGNYMHLRKVRLRIEHAPKLGFLGYLGMSFHAIEIGKTIFTEEEFHVKTLMPSLKTLAVEVSYSTEGYISWFMKLLELFPRLEALYIRSDSWSEARAAAPGSWEVLRSVPCMDNHLEKVVFEVYRGSEWQLDMAKFLHGRSRFLEIMEFHCMDDTGREDDGKAPSEEWVRKQQELLCLDSRAARDARFLFFGGQLVCNHQYICHQEWYKRQYYRHLYEV